MLAFDEARHVYTWAGAPVPGVTDTLTGALGNDFGFVQADVLERARNLGTAVHRMIELDVAGRLDESSVTGILIGYLGQWRDFLAMTGFMVKQSELRLYSKRYGYAGTLDLLGDFPGVRPADLETLIDTKSGAVPRTARPQTAAYSNLLVENGICSRPPRRRALALKHDDWKLSEPYTDPRDMNVFLAALTLNNWKAAA